MSTAAATTLEARDLQLQVGSFTLGKLSFVLDPGDYLVLLGPSGCGKTTLLRALAGLRLVRPGMLFLGGADIGRLAPHRRRMGYVAQAVDLFPHLDVARNIGFGLRYLGLTASERQARFARIVELLGLSELLGRDTTSLSGGESKRVSVARSLVTEPRILLLDEPLSMLDHNARVGMLATLRMIHDELGTATIHVTHDREEAWALSETGAAGRLAGRCAVMRAGRIEQIGRVEDLFRRPSSRFVADFLGGANLVPASFDGSEAKVAWGRIRLEQHVAYARGWVHIRPEALVPAGPDDEGAFPATVRAVRERGVYCEVTLEAAGGGALTMHVPAGTGWAAAPGADVRLRCTKPAHAISEDGDA